MKNIFKNKIILLMFLSISMLSGRVKIDIIKSAAPQYIEGERTIHYTLIIHNESVSETYPLPIKIEDDLLYTGFSNDDINITDDADFNCTVDTNNTDSEIVCLGELTKPDELRYIKYDVIAPDESMQITNNASVTDNDGFINTASMTVTIFPDYDEDLDYSRDLCYIPLENTETCQQSGAFFYGSNCDTSVIIKRSPDAQILRNIYNVHIFKSYTSTVDTENCYTITDGVQGTTCGIGDSLDDLLNKSSSLYLETAFNQVLDFSLNNFDDITNTEENRTIVDINTVPGSKRENVFEYIALVAQYNDDETDDSEAHTIEEYVYPCTEPYGIPPVITPLTSAGINDVNLQNEDVTSNENDINSIYIPYATYSKMGTKIVNQPFILGVTYLDADGNVATYNGNFGDDGKNQNSAQRIINAAVILSYLANGRTEDNPEPLWAGEIHDGASHIITNEQYVNDQESQNSYPIIKEAFREGQLMIQLIDYGGFFRAIDNLQCGDSSLNSSLCLVPACLNSATQITNVFPIENYPHIATCIYGDGAGAAPCDSQAYYGGNCAGKRVTISPPKYNNDYGCAMCLADATSEAIFGDPFSTRPKGFSLNVLPDQNDDGLYEAGYPHLIDLNATTGDPSDTTSDDYNTTLEGYYPSEVIAVIGLEENASLSCPDENNESQSIIFNDGYSSGPITYHNVGKVKLVIMDQNWTSIDQANSTCIIDSNKTNPTLDNYGRVGCKIQVEKSMIFVPDHFNIDANLTDHNNVNNFTYLHDMNQYDNDDNYSMGAELTVNIKAMWKEDNGSTGVTSNYMETCYAKDTNLTLILNGTNITYPGAELPAPLTHFLYYNPVEDNGSIDSGEGNYTLPAPIGNTISIPSLSIGNSEVTFPADAPEGNGTTHIEYKLNFNRKIDLVVNPFKINVSDINMTDTDDVREVVLTMTDRNATLYYARSRASMFFYEGITESNVITPILIDVYCDLSPTACAATGIDTVLGAIKAPEKSKWYISRGHTSNDGNITLSIGSPLIEGETSPGSQTLNGIANPNPADITNWIEGEDNTVIVDINGSEVPLTVPIELVRSSDTSTPTIYTNEWLIYNPNEPIPLSPFYKVRFVGDSSWTGEGQTGYIVDVNASLKKHKKMDW